MKHHNSEYFYLRLLDQKSKVKITLLVLLLITTTCFSKIWLPSILSDNMVLQQESKATIWGWTTVVSEKITVTGSWNNVAHVITAHQGVWSLELPTPSAGGPFVITINGHEKIILQNVLIGEVWVCSGQSNMEWTPPMGLNNSDEEIKNAIYPELRFFTVTKHISSNPQDDTPGQWVECSPDTFKEFSSVGYFFGRKLHRDLSIPVGLINSSWGGTNVETWTPSEGLETRKDLVKSIENIKEFPYWPKEPSLAYNAMIHPIINFDIAGTIWYQGESNRPNAAFYYDAFPIMIDSWRDAWGKEFPFYFAQIAPYNYTNDENNVTAAIVRDAQLHTYRTVANTGIVGTGDIGELDNIHPLNKQDVGKRLALWALAKTYGVKGIAFSGPIYKSMEIDGKKITINFDYSENGLMIKGDALREFYVAGSDQEFHMAKAKIVGSTVVVSSSKVKNPVAVRYAFSDTAEINLFNKEGLPSIAFRTDDWNLKNTE